MTRPQIPAWVGWESNPRDGGLRIRYKANVCYRPAVARRHDELSSHPLELNQILSGFSRARDRYASVGSERCTSVSVSRRTNVQRDFIRCLARHLIVIALRLSEN